MLWPPALEQLDWVKSSIYVTSRIRTGGDEIEELVGLSVKDTDGTFVSFFLQGKLSTS